MRYLKAGSIDKAAAAMREGARILAGGSDLLVRLGRVEPWPEAMVDIKSLPGLGELRQSDAGLELGATLRIADLHAAPELRGYHALREACRVFAARQIRERATLGGNLANASPAADSMPPLIVHGAICHTSVRDLPVEELCTGPGSTCLATDEIITGVSLPPAREGSLSFYHKLATRDAMAISIVGVALCLEMEKGVVLDARVALGSVAPTVIRARQAEAALIGSRLEPEAVAEAARLARDEACPIDDIRASARYRSVMIERILGYRLGRLKLRATEVLDS